jgi:hypothetical protein
VGSNPTLSVATQSVIGFFWPVAFFSLRDSQAMERAAWLFLQLIKGFTLPHVNDEEVLIHG